MSRNFKNGPPRRVVIPDENDQPLVSEADGQRFIVERGTTSVVDGEPVLTIENDDVSLKNAGRLFSTGETPTVEVNGDDARIINKVGALISSEDIGIEVNGDDARIVNSAHAVINADDTGIQVNGEDARIVNFGTVRGDVNGISFAAKGADDGIVVNHGTIFSDSRGVDIDGQDQTLINRGRIIGTGDQRNGTVYADNTADDYVIRNYGQIDAGDGNQGAGISLSLGENVDAKVVNSGLIEGRGNAAASSPLAGDGIRLTSGVDGQSNFEGDIVNRGSISSEGANGTVAGVRVANGVGFEGTLTNTKSGRITGTQNGVYFGNADHNGGEFINRGTVKSDSRAVNLDGDDLSFFNSGTVQGTGDQRNGTVYIDGTGDDISVENRGTIDAGRGNLGDGISVQVGASSEDAINENIDIVNRGDIQGRGQAEFAEGQRVASNGSSGVRYFNGSGEPEAIVTGNLVNSGTIAAEVNVGFLGGVVVEDGVAFDGKIVNEKSGVISGPRNGLYIGNAEHDLTIQNSGRIESGSRAVNLDGDNVTFRNFGDVIGTGDQRNGTVYIDGTGDDIAIKNAGDIDAGKGNVGDGISVQVGSASEDAVNENINIVNRGDIQGRGQAEFADGGRVGANGSSGVRFFNGSGEAEATVTGSIVNSGNIAAEVDVGFLGGVVVEDGVAFDGTISNERGGVISGPRNGLYIGNAEHDLTIQNSGRIESGSRAVNLDGDNVTFRNFGDVIGTGDQRNGTVYIDGTGDDIAIKNAGDIDAGKGNVGDGISVQVGSASEDAVNENINIVNRGDIQGRGQAEFADGGRVGANGSSGVRFFNGSGEAEATVTGSIVNSGTITAEVDVGFLGGVVVEDGVAFDGTIVNARGGEISGPRNGLYIGNAEHDLTIQNHGLIESGSRAVNLDGDNVDFQNFGRVIGTGDQRNGTVYLDGTADDVDVKNAGIIDAGAHNNGSGISVQVGSASEDALNESIDITNSGLIVGRGEANVPAGVRFFNGSGEDVATVEGSIVNRKGGAIVSENEAGILIEDGVAFEGTITNAGLIKGGNGVAIDASQSEGDITLNQNGGAIRGDVLLGDGDDVVNVNGGLVLGEIDGGAGEDELNAGDRGNTLNGGADNDLLVGGHGSDTFVFERGTDQDTVEQFNVHRDLLDLSDFGFESVSDVQAAAKQVHIGGKDVTVIDLDGDAGADQVTLIGVRVEDLNDRNVALGDDATGV